MSSYTLQIAPDAGTKVYAKKGVVLNYYVANNYNRLELVPPEGGSKGQSSPPSRKDGEYVGEATGKVAYIEETQLIEVKWVNRWWQDGTIFPPQRGRFMESNRREYVKLEQLEYEGIKFQTFYSDPEKEDPQVVAEIEKKKQEQEQIQQSIDVLAEKKGSGWLLLVLGLALISNSNR